MLIVFLWAAGEATVWPIIADFALVPVIVANRRRPQAPLLAAVAGMALGGIATFLAGWRWPEWALKTLLRLPLVHEDEVRVVERRLDERGVRAFLTQPWSGIPYKVWGTVAGARRLNPLTVIPAFVVARALRMALSAGLTLVVTRTFTRLLRDAWLVAVPVYVAIFALGLRRLQRRPRAGS